MTLELTNPGPTPPSENAVFLDGLQGVGGTGRMKATCGAEQGGDDSLVSDDQGKE